MAVLPYTVSVIFRKWLPVIGVIVCLAIGTGIFFITFHRDVEPESAPELTAADVLPYLKDGDIILRLGDGPLSPMFRNVSPTDRRFSHLGIVRIRDETITVIHSLGVITNRNRGVEETSLERFLRNARSAGIFRTLSADGTAISDKALTFIGIPFDWSFNLSDDSRIYCTELLYVVLKYVAPDITLKTVFLDTIGKEIIPLDSISNSSAFYEVAYFY